MKQAEDANSAREATALKADAYVVKSQVATDLMLAISEVLAERKFLSPKVKLYAFLTRHR